jgi:hypothetical protein
MRGATSDHPNWGAAWRQSDLDLVKSAEFQDSLRQQQFHLITWRELGKARVRSAPSRSLQLSQTYRSGVPFPEPGKNP